MDTNVFISSLKPDDPYSEEAKKIVAGLKVGEVAAETSTFTLFGSSIGVWPAIQ